MTIKNAMKQLTSFNDKGIGFIATKDQKIAFDLFTHFRNKKCNINITNNRKGTYLVRMFA